MHTEWDEPPVTDKDIRLAWIVSGIMVAVVVIACLVDHYLFET